jgi:hypothetical protein
MTNGKTMHTLANNSSGNRHIVAIRQSNPSDDSALQIPLPGVATPDVFTVLSELRPGA